MFGRIVSMVRRDSHLIFHVLRWSCLDLPNTDPQKEATRLAIMEDHREVMDITAQKFIYKKYPMNFEQGREEVERIKKEIKESFPETVESD